MNFTTLIMLIFTAILAIGLVSKGLKYIRVWMFLWYEIIGYKKIQDLGLWSNLYKNEL